MHRVLHCDDHEGLQGRLEALLVPPGVCHGPGEAFTGRAVERALGADGALLGSLALKHLSSNIECRCRTFLFAYNM